MERDEQTGPEAFGKYEVRGLIGAGGFGRVFRGWDPTLRREVAIKTCSLPGADMRERFFREAEIVASLRHPSITTVYDFGEEAGEPYLVQEYLTGEDLSQIVSRRDPLPLATRIGYLTQIAEGLGYAHDRGVIHRDVKPANMRLLDDGQIRIMDFGIARLVEETRKLTDVGMTVGTAGYLSPEQLRGLDVDSRSDLFALGVLAYELLSYERPFEGDSVSALFYAIAHEDPAPIRDVWPACPPDVADAVGRCLEKDRERRYQTAGQFAAKLSDRRGGVIDRTVVVGGGGGVETPRGVQGQEQAADPSPATGPPVVGRTTGLRRATSMRGLAFAGAAIALVGVIFGMSALIAEDAATVRPPPPSRAVDTAAVRSQDTPDPSDHVPPYETHGVSEAESIVEVRADPGPVSEPIDGPDAPVATAEADTLLAPLEPEPYVGTSTLVVVFADGGDSSSSVVTAAETALLEELQRRRFLVADGTSLQMAQDSQGYVVGWDAAGIAAAGRRHGAALVIIGTLSATAAPAVGRFFTGSAVLDVRAYRVEDAALMLTNSYHVGGADVAGKLGASLAVAEREAAVEVARTAASSLASELGNAMPRRR